VCSKGRKRVASWNIIGGHQAAPSALLTGRSDDFAR
jgi:hypothetical protein